jgi:hypothetical protein
MHHRMVFSLIETTLRSFRVPPVCIENVGPPVVVVTEVNPPKRFLENHRSWYEHLGLCSWIILGIRRSFRGRKVTRGIKQSEQTQYW